PGDGDQLLGRADAAKCALLRENGKGGDTGRTRTVIGRSARDPLQDAAVFERFLGEAESPAMRDLEGWFLEEEALLGMVRIDARLNGLVVEVGLVAEKREFEASLATNGSVAVGSGASGHRENRDYVLHEAQFGFFAGRHDYHGHYDALLFPANDQAAFSVLDGADYALCGDLCQRSIFQLERALGGHIAFTRADREGLRGIAPREVNGFGIGGNAGAVQREHGERGSQEFSFHQ